MAVHDTVYLLDFFVKELDIAHQEKGGDAIAEYVIQTLSSYEQTNMSKFIGAGFPEVMLEKTPRLCSRLWLDLDIVPLSLPAEIVDDEEDGVGSKFWNVKEIDEQADSMARKCIM